MMQSLEVLNQNIRWKKSLSIPLEQIFFETKNDLEKQSQKENDETIDEVLPDSELPNTIYNGRWLHLDNFINFIDSRHLRRIESSMFDFISTDEEFCSTTRVTKARILRLAKNFWR